MEVRGHILPAPGTYSPAGSVPGRLQELRERQRGLRQALGLRLRELRRLCLQEAELTGKLPPEFPLEPGERPQPPPRRRAGVPPRGPPPEVCRARREAQAQAQVQAQVLEAARRLAAVPGLPPEQRRRRLRLQAEAAQRLRQLRAQLGTPDENGSLSELPALENGEGGPARTLPRSASSFEGRSVPATPVLARSPRGAPQNRAAGTPPGSPTRSATPGPCPGASSANQRQGEAGEARRYWSALRRRAAIGCGGGAGAERGARRAPERRGPVERLR
ncbi:PREDICTED: coiled-coil domain-containing protein 120 [Pseudopodoces humilis]|uniref:coiled-coil domain-containing protein 120 n=1 Tax=Pseudopodoces humilis TaxID=181119 RepID=UPI0006B7FE45|nr:PREDICTED: coiled-coil domain-containing protein 120 [Pseudopodoces humilis]